MKRISSNTFYLSLIVLFAAGLRIFNLGRNSLWTDEAGFMQFRTGGILDSLRYSLKRITLYNADMATPAFSFFAILWSSLVSGEFMLRLSSVIFAVMSIFLIYKLGKTLFDHKVGLISAYLLAISPFHVYYSQEFRMYSLITFLSIASAIFLVKFLETERKIFLSGYVVSHILSIYFHITTFLILFAQIVFSIIYLRRKRRLFKNWLWANLIIMILLSPEAFLIIRSVEKNSWNYFLSTTISTVSELGHLSALIPFYTLKNFCLGYNTAASVWWPAALLFFGLSIFAMVKTDNRTGLYMCLACLLIPSIIMYAIQRFIYADRFLIASSAFLYLIVANGVFYFKKPLFMLAIISIICFFGLANYYKGYLPGSLEQRIAVHSKKSHREAANYLLNHLQEGDAIFHTQANTPLPLQYYFNYFKEDKRNYSLNKYQYSLVLRLSADEKRLLPTEIWAKVSPNESDRSDTVSIKGHRRVWLIFSAREFDEALQPYSYERKILKLMQWYYDHNEVKYFSGINLYLFTNPNGRD